MTEPRISPTSALTTPISVEDAPDEASSSVLDDFEPQEDVYFGVELSQAGENLGAQNGARIRSHHSAANSPRTSERSNPDGVSSRANSSLLLALPLGAVILVCLTSLFAWRTGNQLAPLVIGVQMVAAVVGLVLCGVALNQAGKVWSARLRLAWAFFGLAALFSFIGNVVYGLALRRGPVEIPSGADLWWLLEQPLLISGLLLLAWRGHGRLMLRLLVDTLIVVLAAIVLSWSVVLEHKLVAESQTSLAKVVAIAYPIFDIALLFCILMLLTTVRDRPGLARASFWLLGGVIAFIAADSIYAYNYFSRQLAVSPLADLFHGLGYPFVGLAALWHARHPEVVARSVGEQSGEGIQNSLWEQRFKSVYRSAILWMPYVATLVVSAFLIADELRKSNTEIVQRLLPVLALLLAIVARQMMTLWDNLRLAEKLQKANSHLEHNVGERTRHLETLHGITSTLNTSLDRRTVLRVTLEKTMIATQAEGGGIWLRETRRDIYTDGAPSEEWTLVDWQGLNDDAGTVSLLRDLSIAAAEAENGSSASFHLSPATREAIAKGIAPPAQRLIHVPIRWQGALLGVLGLLRCEGSFTYEDRALVESVALEAGTALQNARLYSEAAHRADRDSVTELFNHRALQEQLGKVMARCKRTGDHFSIVMMDLNNFKFFNDTYGHPVGDDVLRAVARAMRDSCRVSDVLGRYGGDEFLAILPDTDADGAVAACQRIKSALDARHFEPVPGTRLPISTSYGWATFPSDGDNILEILTAADQNLYGHKRGGTVFSQRARKDKAAREELRRLKDRSVGGSFGVLDALVTAIDNKDRYTRHHSEEVTYLSMLVARELGYDEERLGAVRISGLLHDVGKIAVPDDILRHPGKLGRDEWEIMQQHPVFGALIVKDVPQLDLVIDGIKYHHEKWDGTGYPECLAGEGIPEMGRLLAMGDCYSALTTDRPYRKGWKPEAALEEIERCAGTQFDPRLCAAFLTVMRRELKNIGEDADYESRIAEDFGT